MELEPVGDAGGTGGARELGPGRRRFGLQFVQVAVVVVMMVLVLVLYQALHALNPAEDVGPADVALPAVPAAAAAPAEAAPPAADMAPPPAELGAITSQSSGSAFVCGGDAVAVGNDVGKEMTSQTWTQQRDERVRVKLWGAGGMGGPPVRLTPEGGCGDQGNVPPGPMWHERQLRRGGGYRGTGTRADLNNHANQMNPNNWRYWSSRGMSPPWRSTGSGAYAPYMAPTAPVAPRAAAGNGGAAPSADPSATGSAFRFRRGLPLRVLRHWARRAMKAARKWLPRQRRWKVSRSDPTSVGPCGELWLCGGGGGAGAFTDAVVNLTAGKRYALQVGVGGFPSSPRGGATRLVELFDGDGGVAQVLAEAQGGFGATAVDEERLVALGGAGAPASNAGGQWSQPGIDGEASRSSFEDLDHARLPLVGANLTMAQAMAPDELNLSLAAVRIPCAGAVKEGAEEYEAGLTGGTFFLKYNVNVNAIGTFWRRAQEPVTDHMLVCLPPDGGAYGYDSKRLQIGDLFLLDEKCGRDDFVLRNHGDALQQPKTVEIGGQRYYVVQIVDIPGQRLLFELLREIDLMPESSYIQHIGFDGSYAVPVVMPRAPTIGYNQNQRKGQVYYEKDSACLIYRYGIGAGSQCLGSACVRDATGQGPCTGLPSCLDGLAAWSGRWNLSNRGHVENTGRRSPTPRSFAKLQVPTSSSGPKGGISTATPNGRPAGHGGSGTCPELVPELKSQVPMARALPRHAAPQQGEDGMAMFYKCST